MRIIPSVFALVFATAASACAGSSTAEDAGAGPPAPDAGPAQSHGCDAPDGTRCDDGDPCTRDDRCASGTCAGTATTSVPELIGRISNFAADWPVGPNRVVGTSRAGLNVVDITDEGLLLQSVTPGERAVTAVWTAEDGAAYVLTYPNRIHRVHDDGSTTLVATIDGVTLEDQGSSLTPICVVASGYLYGQDAARGSGVVVDVRDPSAPVVTPTNLTLTHLMTASASGRRLYRREEGRVQEIDLVDPVHPVVVGTTGPASGPYRGFGAAWGERLVETTENVVVIDPDTLTETVWYEPPPSYELLGPKVEGDTLYVLRAHRDGGRYDAADLLRFDLGAGPGVAPTIRAIPPSAVAGSRVLLHASPEGLLVIERDFVNAFYPITPDGLDGPLAANGYGSVYALVGDGPDRALGLGYGRSHVIDLSDPTHPEVVESTYEPVVFDLYRARTAERVVTGLAGRYLGSSRPLATALFSAEPTVVRQVTFGVEPGVLALNANGTMLFALAAGEPRVDVYDAAPLIASGTVRPIGTQDGVRDVVTDTVDPRRVALFGFGTEDCPVPVRSMLFERGEWRLERTLCVPGNPAYAYLADGRLANQGIEGVYLVDLTDPAGEAVVVEMELSTRSSSWTPTPSSSSPNTRFASSRSMAVLRRRSRTSMT